MAPCIRCLAIQQTEDESERESTHVSPTDQVWSSLSTFYHIIIQRAYSPSLRSRTRSTSNLQNIPNRFVTWCAKYESATGTINAMQCIWWSCEGCTMKFVKPNQSRVSNILHSFCALLDRVCDSVNVLTILTLIFSFPLSRGGWSIEWRERELNPFVYNHTIPFIIVSWQWD